MTQVDRQYSQFEEIRHYQDRGMMKWQGFFLSEHTNEMTQATSPKTYYLYRVTGYLI